MKTFNITFFLNSYFCKNNKIFNIYIFDFLLHKNPRPNYELWLYMTLLMF